MAAAAYLKNYWFDSVFKLRVHGIVLKYFRIHARTVAL